MLFTPQPSPFPLAAVEFRTEDLALLVAAVVGAVALVLVVRWRQKDFARNSRSFAVAEVCEHLRPALDHVLANGGQVTRAGQNHPDLPLEVHVDPPFDPKALYEQLKLEPPVHVSERNVLYCKDDWCELHPTP